MCSARRSAAEHPPGHSAERQPKSVGCGTSWGFSARMMKDSVLTARGLARLGAACCLVSVGCSNRVIHSAASVGGTPFATRAAFAHHATAAARAAALRLRNSSAARRSAAVRTRSSATGGAGVDTASSLSQDALDERVKAAIASLPRRPHCAVVGGGFAGLATAYHLASFGSDVTVFDPNEVGTGGASAVAAGLLHPLTPRGKLIWKGEEGFAAAKELIEVANANLPDEVGQGEGQATRGCLMTDKVYRPLMDGTQYDMYKKAAEDIPQWVQRLTREEYLQAVPGSDTKCLGGVVINGALAVDAPLYLKGLWAACRGVASTNRNDGGDSSSTEGATWVGEKVDDIHSLAASGEFNAVVACVGPGVRVLAGVKDIASLRLVRGQTLLYDNVIPEPPPPPPHVESLTTTPAAAAGGGGASAGDKMLTGAVLCGQYVVPSTVDWETGKGGKLLCGSTQEPVLSGEKVDKPADMAKALRQLVPKIAKFFPALVGVEPLGVSSGVRVIQDRNSYGRIPIAGRLPFSKKGWVVAALGARGLIHHAYLGRLVAACALLDSDEHLPPQVMAPLEDLGKESTGDL